MPRLWLWVAIYGAVAALAAGATWGAYDGLQPPDRVVVAE